MKPYHRRLPFLSERASSGFLFSVVLKRLSTDSSKKVLRNSGIEND